MSIIADEKELELFNERKKYYLELFDGLGYIPPFEYAACYFNEEIEFIKRDYKQLGVRPITEKKLFKLKLEKEAEEFRDIFEEYYFFAEEYITLEELSQKLHMDYDILCKEIDYLVKKYKYNRPMKKEDKFTSQRIDEMFSRLSVYLKYNLGSNSPVSFVDLAKILDITKDNVSEDFVIAEEVLHLNLDRRKEDLITVTV